MIKHIRKSERGEYELAASILMLVVLVVIGGGFAIAKNSHRTHLTNCVVESKDRTRTDSGSDARIYTENCGVMRVQDTLLGGQFDSADVYGSIEVGKTYNFTTTGWRVGFLSMFPNIIKVEEVK